MEKKLVYIAPVTEFTRVNYEGMIAATIDLQEDVRVNGITGETVPGEKQIGYIYLSVSSGQNGQEWKNIDKNVFTFWLESDPPDEIRQGTAQSLRKSRHKARRYQLFCLKDKVREAWEAK